MLMRAYLRSTALRPSKETIRGKRGEIWSFSDGNESYVPGIRENVAACLLREGDGSSVRLQRKKKVQILRIFIERVIKSTTGIYQCCSRASDLRMYMSHPSGYRD